MMKNVVLATLFLASSFPATAALGVWEYEKKVDGFTDDVTHIASIMVKDGMHVKGVIVRCDNGELNAYVAVGDYLNSDGPVKVKFRLDDDEPIDDSWPLSTTGTATFAPDPRAFAEQLMAASSLLFRAYDYQGTPHDQEFTLKGSGAAISKVLNSCPAPG